MGIVPDGVHAGMTRTDRLATSGRVPASSERTVRPVRLLAAMALWVGLAVLAVLNATVRELLVAPVVGDYWGHVVSTVTFIAALSVVAYWYFTLRTDHTVTELAVVGAAWLVATALFEFGFGHYVMDNSWAALLADDDLLAGRVWVLVLLALAVAPVLFGDSLKR